MDEDVKTGPRRGTRRREQARATRRRIIDAGLDLFLRQGYAATTLEQIADQAGVAVQTLYFHFGNKRTVLKEIVDVVAVGDDEPVALLDRPWMQQLRAEPDARRALTIWIRNSRAIFARVAPIMRIVRDAAGADPDMATQWDVNQQQRFTAHHTLAQQLADKHGLRQGLSVAKAADIIFALLSLDMYLLLTVERGWAPALWERWITSTLTEAVLR
jgi:AcrR family transcriptional regulator